MAEMCTAMYTEMCDAWEQFVEAEIWNELIPEDDQRVCEAWDALCSEQELMETEYEDMRNEAEQTFIMRFCATDDFTMMHKSETAKITNDDDENVSVCFFGGESAKFHLNGVQVFVNDHYAYDLNMNKAARYYPVHPTVRVPLNEKVEPVRKNKPNCLKGNKCVNKKCSFVHPDRPKRE